MWTLKYDLNIFTKQQQPHRRKWHPTPVFLPGKSHGQRSLIGSGLWGHKELDTTERLHFHFQQTHRHRKQAYDYQRGKGMEDG